jgi:hypothetical protein
VANLREMYSSILSKPGQLQNTAWVHEPRVTGSTRHAVSVQRAQARQHGERSECTLALFAAFVFVETHQPYSCPMAEPCSQLIDIRTRQPNACHQFDGRMSRCVAARVGKRPCVYDNSTAVCQRGTALCAVSSSGNDASVSNRSAWPPRNRSAWSPHVLDESSCMAVDPHWLCARVSRSRRSMNGSTAVARGTVLHPGLGPLPARLVAHAVHTGCEAASCSSSATR